MAISPSGNVALPVALRQQCGGTPVAGAISRTLALTMAAAVIEAGGSIASHLQAVGISGYQRLSAIIRGHPRPSAATGGNRVRGARRRHMKAWSRWFCMISRMMPKPSK